MDKSGVVHSNDLHLQPSSVGFAGGIISLGFAYEKETVGGKKKKDKSMKVSNFWDPRRTRDCCFSLIRLRKSGHTHVPSHFLAQFFCKFAIFFCIKLVYHTCRLIIV